MTRSNEVKAILLSVEFACICSIALISYIKLDWMIATLILLLSSLAVCMQREVTNEEWMQMEEEG